MELEALENEIWRLALLRQSVGARIATADSKNVA
jgi:hypothetical protein